ncbi:LUC7-domain-containing protein [Amniculicola lignicola CBS 123094]|uniref:LUC7-domain-containing protein n=1 Tax=Amniculicola lignicola CBS 123094 TaxID=1392246 RepID=A0A6A5W849_9PLEO|nr:LUC7-domain-containing protein [Amniculicola lignicola CBS 123094]
MAAAETRRMLAQLMGEQAMTGASSQAPQYGITDDKVCKSYLVGQCPYDLFNNTKMDIGTCSKVHVETLRTEYQEAPQEQKDRWFDFKREYLHEMARHIDECDRRIGTAQRRLEKTPEEIRKTNALVKQIDDLNKSIDAGLLEVQIMGEMGEVNMALAEYFRAQQRIQEKEILERELKSISDTGGPSGHQKLQVCDVCGAYLSRLDNDRRLADHFYGKMHLGYSQMRKSHADLKVEVNSRPPSAATGMRGGPGGYGGGGYGGYGGPPGGSRGGGGRGVTPHVLTLESTTQHLPPSYLHPLHPRNHAKRYNSIHDTSTQFGEDQEPAQEDIASIQQALQTLGGRVYMTNLTLGGNEYTFVIDTGSSDTWIASSSFECLSRTTSSPLPRSAYIPKIFSLALGRPTKDNPTEGGLIAIGGIPDIPYKGPFVSVPIRPLVSMAFAFYSIPAGGFVVKPPQKPLVQSSSSQSKLEAQNQIVIKPDTEQSDKELQMVIDSGTSLIYLPDQIADYVANLFIPAATYNVLSNLYLVSCTARAPQFAILIAGRRFWISEGDLLNNEGLTGIVGGSGEATCVLAIQRKGNGDAVLGDAFLRNVVSVFDLGEGEMRFAARE